MSTLSVPLPMADGERPPRLKVSLFFSYLVFSGITLVSATAIHWEIRHFAILGFFYLLRMSGVAVAYHRYFTHRQYSTSRFFQFILACWGSLSLQYGPLWWAARHRDHHRFCDTALDPHLRGVRHWIYPHLLWLFDERNHKNSIPKDLKAFPELRLLERYYWIPSAVVAALCWMLWGLDSLVPALFVSTFLIWQCTSLINSTAHPPIGGEGSIRNSKLLAFLTFGEGNHGNHHKFPTSPCTALDRGQVDLGFYILKTLEFFGLIWELRPLARKPFKGGDCAVS